MTDILQAAYGAPPDIKQLKSFWLDHKQTLSGCGKFEKNDVKFQKHGFFDSVANLSYDYGKQCTDKI